MAENDGYPAEAEDTEAVGALEQDEIVTAKRTYSSEDLEYVRVVIAEDLQEAREAMEAAKLERIRAYRSYRAKPYGNERPGHSTYIEPVVSNTVHAILPSLLRIFLSGDRVIEFRGRNPEDDIPAQTMEEIVDWQVQTLNDGFFLLHDSFKDAMLWPNGYIETGWKKIVEPMHEAEMSVEDFVDLRLDPMIEVYSYERNREPRFIPAEVHTDPESGELVVQREDETVFITKSITDVHYGRVEQSQPTAECFHPAQFFLGKGEVSIQNAQFAAREYKVPFSTLKQQEKSEENPTGVYINLESLARSLSPTSTDLQSEEYRQELPLRDSQFSHDDRPDRPFDLGRQLITVSRCWPMLDLDREGRGKRYLAELANDHVLIRFEELPFSHGEVPVISLVANRDTHQHHGISYASELEQLQQLMTAITRQIIDNMTWCNYGYWILGRGAGVDPMDLLSMGPKDYLQAHDINQVRRETPQYFGEKAIEVLEYFDSRTERRTGVGSHHQGLDPESLNKTARGMSMLLTQSQQRIEMLARLLAESLKPMLRQFAMMNQQFLDRRQQFRLQGREEPVLWDPDRMTFDFDLIANVGIGSGDKQQRLQDAQYILELILKNLNVLGSPEMGLITPQNVYNAVEDAIKQIGRRDASRYLTEPREQMAVRENVEAITTPEQTSVMTEGAA
jgi:hypothetical protein